MCWDQFEKGVKLVIVGNSGKTENLVEVCKDADALVIKSTYLDEETEMASQFSHLTARQGADLAIKAGVKKLILTYLTPLSRERCHQGSAGVISQYQRGTQFRYVSDQAGRVVNFKLNHSATDCTDEHGIFKFLLEKKKNKPNHCSGSAYSVKISVICS